MSLDDSRTSIVEQVSYDAIAKHGELEGYSHGPCLARGRVLWNWLASLGSGKMAGRTNQRCVSSNCEDASLYSHAARFALDGGRSYRFASLNSGKTAGGRGQRFALLERRDEVCTNPLLGVHGMAWLGRLPGILRAGRGPS